MKNLAIFLGLSIAIFVTAQMAKATQVINDTLQVDSLKVGQQGVGGVTFFNGTIVNETTTDGADNPVAFGDNVRIDGRLYRGATAGTGDSLPLIINDNAEIAGSLETNSLTTGTLTATTLTATNLTATNLTATDLTTDTLTTDSINLTVLDNLGCTEGYYPYFGDQGWECNAEASLILYSFLSCLNDRIAGDTNVTVADWTYCYNLVL